MLLLDLFDARHEGQTCRSCSGNKTNLDTAYQEDFTRLAGLLHTLSKYFSASTPDITTFQTMQSQYVSPPRFQTTAPRLIFIAFVNQDAVETAFDLSAVGKRASVLIAAANDKRPGGDWEAGR
jgi:hypothetical protein